jgi:large subunit ribosomal protein L28
MSRKCPVTGKGPMFGNQVSHSMRHTRRRWDVNLQTTTITVNGHKERIRVSTSALRTMRKNAKAAAKTAAPAAAPVVEAPKAEAVKTEAPKAEAPKAEEAK